MPHNKLAAVCARLTPCALALFVLVGFTNYVAPAAADVDTTPPFVASITMSPLSLDVTTSDAELTIDAVIVDVESGVDSCHFDMAGPGGHGLLQVVFTQADGDGDIYNGHYQVRVSLAQNSTPGQWKITPIGVTCADVEGNTGTRSTVDLDNDDAGAYTTKVNVNSSGLPQAPTNVIAAAGDHAATVSWDAPPDNGSTIATYVVTASPGPASKAVSSPTLSTTLSGLDNGTAYTFTVHATVDPDGDGLESEPSNAVTPTASAPLAPTNVSATAGDHAAAVSWAAPVGGSAIDGYVVTASPGAMTQPVIGPALSTNFTGLTNGTAYTFTVHAISGALVGLESLASAPVTPFGAPGAPTNAHATLQKTTATVTWGAAPANGAAVSGYTISAPGTQTKVVSATTRSTKISSLAPGTYRFKVQATNTRGKGPAALSNAVSVASSVAAKTGYWMLGSDGKVYAFGDAHNFGSSNTHAVAMVSRRDGRGYWITDVAGNVKAFGSAPNHGGHPALRSGESVSTISATPTGNGYWLFTDRGRAFAFGDAHTYGDMSGTPLNGPIVASVATATGRGYFMVGSDGGIFAFGDAKFRGSTGGLRLNRPVVGISPTPSGRGYWLVASDGGVFAFDAPFRGSMGGTTLNRPVNGLVAFGRGYLMVASDGGVFSFSDKPFLGSLGTNPPSAPVIGIAAFTT